LRWRSSYSAGGVPGASPQLLCCSAVVDAFQLRLQVSGVPIPSPFLIGMPYILTIVVVAFVAGRAGYPVAINKPYPLRISRAGPES